MERSKLLMNSLPKLVT